LKLYSKTLNIEIHEIKYRGQTTLRLRSIGGANREIDLVRLRGKDNLWTLESIHGYSILHEDIAKKYYSNIKASYLKTFGIKEESA